MASTTELRLLLSFVSLHTVHGFALRPQDIYKVYKVIDSKDVQESTTPHTTFNVKNISLSRTEEKSLSSTKNISLSSTELYTKNISLKLHNDDDNIIPLYDAKIDQKDTIKSKRNFMPKFRTTEAGPLKFNIFREKQIWTRSPAETGDNRKTDFIKILFPWLDRQPRRKPTERCLFFREVNKKHGHDDSCFHFKDHLADRKVDSRIENMIEQRNDFRNQHLHTYPSRRLTTTTEINYKGVLPYFYLIDKENRNINFNMVAGLPTTTRHSVFYKSLFDENFKRVKHDQLIYTKTKKRRHFPPVIKQTGAFFIGNMNRPLNSKKNIASLELNNNVNNMIVKIPSPREQNKIIRSPNLILANSVSKGSRFQNQNQYNMDNDNSIIIENTMSGNRPNPIFQSDFVKIDSEISNYPKTTAAENEEISEDKKKLAEIFIEIQRLGKLRNKTIHSKQMPQSNMQTQILQNSLTEAQRLYNEHLTNAKSLINNAKKPTTKTFFYANDIEAAQPQTFFHASRYDEIRPSNARFEVFQTFGDNNVNLGVSFHNRKTDPFAFEHALGLPKKNQFLLKKIFYNDKAHKNLQLHKDVINNLISDSNNVTKNNLENSKGRLLVNLNLDLQKNNYLNEATHLNKEPNNVAEITRSMLPYGFDPSNLDKYHKHHSKKFGHGFESHFKIFYENSNSPSKAGFQFDKK